MNASNSSGPVLGLAFLLALLAATQRPGDAQTPPGGPPGGAMRVTTRLVLVDVVVTDKQGHPVNDLKQSDFTLLENGKPQQIAMFSLEQPLERARQGVPRPAPLPPNIYTNRPEYQLPPGPLTILLIDALNTPLADQAYGREELLKYLQTQIQSGQGTAILALGNSLRLLQDFTTDPRLLRAAVAKYNGGKSALLDNTIDQLGLPSAEVSSTINLTSQTLLEFQQEASRAQLNVRIQITLAALRAIARKTSGYPGRKVLLWVSGGFPLTLHPEEFFTGAFSHFPDLSGSQFYANEVRRTAALLADAQVAIYPVDARGLVTLPMPTVTGYQAPGGPNARRPALAPRLQIDELITSHEAMQMLADDSGGRAFYDRNDIDHAVALGAAEGATYYELAFYPEGNSADGKFHKLAVKIARSGLELRCRKGYFATDPLRWRELNPKSEQELANAMADPLPATQVTFMARVRPLPASPQPHIEIVFAVHANSVSFEDEPGPQHHANLDFHALVLSPDGKRVAGDNKTMDVHLRDETYAHVRKEGIPLHMDLLVAPGRYQIHLAVRDNRTGALGTLVVPLVIDAPGAANP